MKANTRYCPKCQSTKSISDFRPKDIKDHGNAAWCIACDRTYSRCVCGWKERRETSRQAPDFHRQIDRNAFGRRCGGKRPGAGRKAVAAFWSEGPTWKELLQRK